MRICRSSRFLLASATLAVCFPPSDSDNFLHLTDTICRIYELAKEQRAGRLASSLLQGRVAGDPTLSK